MSALVDIVEGAVFGDNAQLRSEPAQNRAETTRENAQPIQESESALSQKAIAEIARKLTCCCSALRKIPAAVRTLAVLLFDPERIFDAFGVCLVILGVAVAAVGTSTRISAHTADPLALSGVKQLGLRYRTGVLHSYFWRVLASLS